MHSFKGLISRNLINQQSINTLNKKTEQFRKVTLQSSEISIYLLKIYQTYLIQLSRIMSLLLQQTNDQETYYKVLKNIYAQVYKQYHHFILDYLQTPSNQLTNSNSLRYINFSGCVLTFQKQIKNYSSSQLSMIQLGKKYFKTQKNLFISIQAYKESFTEAKLIYNMDQKLRRYSACEQNYKNLQQDHASVHQLKDKLMGKKKQVIQTFQLLSKEMSLHQNQVNAKTFLFLSKFNINLTQNLKKRLVITKQGRKKIQSYKIPNFFYSFSFDQNIFSQSSNDVERRRKANMSNLSALGINAQNNLQTMKRLYARLEKYIQVTKHEHLRIYQFHLQFYKSAEKKSIAQLKQSLSNFEKNKKKIKQQFSQPCYDQFKKTLQIIRVTMEVYSEVHKKIGNKLQNVHENIQQLKSILQKVLQEIMNMIQKASSNMGNKQKDGILSQSVQYKQKVLQIASIIKTADERLGSIMSQIKQSYNEILNIYELGVNQSYDRCLQFSRISKEKQQQMISQIRDNKNERLRSTIFLDLLSDENRGKITFEDEVERNSEFKKLKKPVQIEVIQKEKQPNNPPNFTTNLTKQQIQKQQLGEDVDEKTQNSPQKNKKKHKEFLQSKFTFVEGEEFLSTFSCALADKIILQGRLYVTTHRICFYSSFNPNTVFFRQTFIQVPKKDIITLQKRKNGIFFDNSISITTKNGELFLTSFFKRNQAFKVVSQLIGLNYEQQAYQQQNAFESDTSQMGSPQKQKVTKIEAQAHLLEAQNDLKDQSIAQRIQKIQNILNLSPFNSYFKQCASAQFIFEGLNAYRILKMFLLDDQITIHGKKHVNFSEYFKKNILGHKDIQTTSFQPSIKQHLNPSNITDACPIKFTRKVTSTVPTPSSGIPFMPKWAKTMENQTLLIISKNKWALDTELENSGAPYTDSFKVYYRTICESSISCCRIVTSMYIHFSKSVMVRGIIQSKTHQQSKSQLSKQDEQLKKYFQVQEKQKLKKLRLINMNLKSSSSMDKKDQQGQIQMESLHVQGSEQKIKQLEDKIEQMSRRHNKQVQKIAKQINTYRITIGILILFCIFLQVVL